jgi:hypothetical protein
MWCEKCPRLRHLFKNDLFTKTGSGQTWGTSTKEIVFRRALFDLKRDPHELRNIYNETKAMNPGLVAALDGQLRELYSCSGAGCN